MSQKVRDRLRHGHQILLGSHAVIDTRELQLESGLDETAVTRRMTRGTN